MPGDVSVAGFDDISVAAITAPSLSTVRLPLRDLGRRGFEVATLMLDGGDPEPEILPTALVLRGSTGARACPRHHRRNPMSLNLRGITPACVVTLDADGRFDEAPYRRYLQWLLPQGPVALAINADTGEGPHLWPDERERVLRVAVEEAGDVPIIAGLSAQFTEQAVEEAKRAAGAGASGLLVFPIPAYQGTPLDPAIPVAYHEAIARGCGLPMVAFQLQPALGGVIFSEETLRRIAAIDNVVALKEASFDARLYLLTRRMIESLPRPDRPPDRRRQLHLRVVRDGGRGGAHRVRDAGDRAPGPDGQADRRGALGRGAGDLGADPAARGGRVRGAGPRLPRPDEGGAARAGRDRVDGHAPAAPGRVRVGDGARSATRSRRPGCSPRVSHDGASADGAVRWGSCSRGAWSS